MLEHKHWRSFWSDIPGQDRWTFVQLVDAALADATKVVNAMRKLEGARNIQRETLILNRGKDYRKDGDILYVRDALVMVVISYDVEV